MNTLQAIAKLDDRLITLLDLNKILSVQEKQALKSLPKV